MRDTTEPPTVNPYVKPKNAIHKWEINYEQTQKTRTLTAIIG